MTVIEEHARSIFLAALERRADQWVAFLDETCGDNDAERGGHLHRFAPVVETKNLL